MGDGVLSLFGRRPSPNRGEIVRSASSYRLGMAAHHTLRLVTDHLHEALSNWSTRVKSTSHTRMHLVADRTRRKSTDL